MLLLLPPTLLAERAVAVVAVSERHLEGGNGLVWTGVSLSGFSLALRKTRGTAIAPGPHSTVLCHIRLAGVLASC